MKLFSVFPAEPATPPEIGGPAPGRLLQGSPEHRTWVVHESADGNTVCGIWQSTPGAWRVSYEEWESCTILEGHAVVTPDGEAPIPLGPGDTLVMEPGFSGVWEVTRTLRKSFVVRL